MTCQHPIMNRPSGICAARAKFSVTVAGQRVALDMYGIRVEHVCGRHANHVALRRPGAELVAIASDL